MTKQETLAKLASVAGDSKYADQVIAEFDKNFNDDDKKYGQSLKDRLDDRLGELTGWLKRDEAKGTGNPSEVADHIAVVAKMISVLK